MKTTMRLLLESVSDDDKRKVRMALEEDASSSPYSRTVLAIIVDEEQRRAKAEAELDRIHTACGGMSGESAERALRRALKSIEMKLSATLDVVTTKEGEGV